MNRHYTHCEQESCIICEDYAKWRNQDALLRLIEWRRRRPGQESLTSYESE